MAHDLTVTELNDVPAGVPLPNGENGLGALATGDTPVADWVEPPLEEWATESGRSRLVDHYLPLARSIAGRLYRGRIDQSVPFDDYLQYARIGLLESVARFDPTRGAPFTAYALHRIRGAILNGLAQESEYAAQREAARRLHRERRESLRAHLAGDIDRATLEQLIELTVGLALGVLLENAEEVADESAAANPYQAAELQQLKRLARAAVERLPERERELVIAHYFRQQEFCVLARDWAVSAGRVSQLHAAAIAHLRQLLVREGRLNRNV